MHFLCAKRKRLTHIGPKGGAGGSVEKKSFLGRVIDEELKAIFEEGPESGMKGPGFWRLMGGIGRGQCGSVDPLI